MSAGSLTLDNDTSTPSNFNKYLLINFIEINFEKDTLVEYEKINFRKLLCTFNTCTGRHMFNYI